MVTPNFTERACLMDVLPFSAPHAKIPLQYAHSDPAGQTLQNLEVLADQSQNLARWRPLLVEGQVVPSYVLIGPRTGSVPIRLALVGGTRATDLLSTIAIVKVLLELHLAPLIAQDFALFAYPLANPARLTQPEPDFDTSFWKDSADPVVRFFEHELTVDELDGMIAVRGNEPVAGLQIQASSRVIAAEVLWRALELPQKIVPLATEPVQIFTRTEAPTHSFSNLRHLCPKPFSLIIRTPGNAPAANQISAVAFSIKQILFHYRSLVHQAGRVE
jgi:hypothetical protein